MGIDPASNLSGTIELGDNVTLISAFYGKDEFLNRPVFDPAIPGVQEFDTILARHCFCHQEWHPFLRRLVDDSHKDTLVCIEVPYAPDLLARAEFDSIYHEHTSYLTLKSVVAALKGFPFHLHGVLKYGIHGGAVLVMLRHNDSGITPHLSADEMLAEENVTEESWNRFKELADEKIHRLRVLVGGFRNERKIVSIFGASAKSSVMISACGFTRKDIAFITDNSPLKPGRLAPGTDIPVIEEGEMLSQHPDYAICGAWNYRTEVSRQDGKVAVAWRQVHLPDAGWVGGCVSAIPIDRQTNQE